MSNGKLIGVAAIIVVIIAVIAVGWYQFAQRSASNGDAGSTVAGVDTPGAPIASTSTRTAALVGVVAPNKGATSSVAANVAIPVVQGPGDPAGNVDYRSFNISIDNGVYTPNTVIVNQDDTVNLELTAVDAAYGFDQPDYGWNKAIPEGKTQNIQFQALQSGDFTFYCASCGGPASGPVGHIIVVAK